MGTGSSRRRALRRSGEICEALESRLLLSRTIYVDAASPGPVRDGTTWNQAYKDLQLALGAAVSGDTVKVADGTYKPSTGTSRSATFQLKSGVGLYGGYAGAGAADPDARDVTAFESILSGNIGSADSVADNVYHVVTGSGVKSNAVLDGFMVTGGNADGWGDDAYGGGMCNINVANIGDLTVAHCTFNANSARDEGGGVYNGWARPLMTNCVLVGNCAMKGAGMYNKASSPRLLNCSFLRNDGVSAGSASVGAGMFNDSAWDEGPELTNCIFLENAACDGGGAMCNADTSLWLTGCTFLGNRANRAGGAILDLNASPTLSNCSFSGNCSAEYGGSIASQGDSSLDLRNCTFSGNTARVAGGALWITTTLSMYNCIVWGNASPLSPEIYREGGTASVIYSDVRGGEFSGPGNIDVNPGFFRDPSSGADGRWGTPDDDYGDLQLLACSPAADCGDNLYVPPWVLTDLAGHSRFFDILTTVDTGAGSKPIVDMGAYEAVPALSATAGGTYVVITGQTLSLEGRGSSNRAGGLTYAWDLDGDGKFDDATGTSPQLATSGLTVGTRTVALRVTDSSGRRTDSTATLRLVPAVVYVDSRAIGQNDGTSWTDAMTSLSLALRNAVPGQQLRVAGGIYKPTNTFYRDISFELTSGVALWGGYAGVGSADPNTRDTVHHATILSGDIGIVGDNSDNSYHVVGGSGTDATASIDGFTIAGGNADSAQPSFDYTGSGIYIFRGSPTVAHCTLAENTAAGGVMKNVSSSPRVQECVFTSNVGAAIVNELESSPDVIDCIFERNSGCGVANSRSSPMVTDCRFIENGQSGLRNLNLSSPEMVNCTFIRNGESGVSNYMSSSPALVGCRFYGNASDYGGGMYNYDSSPVLTNCLFTGNRASVDGGAIFNAWNCAAVIGNCTFAKNEAAGLGGAVCSVSSGSSISNSIFWGNTAIVGDQIYQEDGYTSITYCDVEGGYAGTGNINVDPLFEHSPHAGADNVFGSADDDYGNLQLLACSPAADAADSSTIPSAVTTDVAGNSRFMDVPTTEDSGAGPVRFVDMGAYEAIPVIVADPGGQYAVVAGSSIALNGRGASDLAGELTFAWDWNDDGVFTDAFGPNPVFSAQGMSALTSVAIAVRVSDAESNVVVSRISTIYVASPVMYVDAAAVGNGDGNTWASAATDLHSAMERALPGQELHVASGTYVPTHTSVREASFQLKSGVVLLGGYAGGRGPEPNARDIATWPTILSGDIPGYTNSYHVVTAEDAGSTAILDGFIITEGHADGQGLSTRDGAGLYVQGGAPSIRNCTFTNNYSASDGAAVYCQASAPTLIDCQFRYNRAMGSGGGVSSSGATPTLIDCRFTANSATSYGGGMFSSASTPSIIGCTFVSDSTTGQGPELYDRDSAAAIVNCIIWNASDSALSYTKTTPLISWTDIRGGFTGTGNINSDPLFVRNPSPGPDGKWGTTDDDFGDLRLQASSPCIDAGSNAAVPASLTTDLAGNPRIVDIPGVRDPGAIVDMGAFESPLPLLTVSGSAGDDQLYVRPSDDQSSLQVWSGDAASGEPSATYALAGITTVVLDLGAGNDAVTLDLSNGLPAVAFSIIGGDGEDQLTLAGTDAADALEFSPGTITFGAATVTMTDIEEFCLGVVGNGGVEVGSLVVGTPVRMTGGGDLTLHAGSVSITDAGSLDLAGGTLILDYAGASPLPQIRHWIQNGQLGMRPALKTASGQALGFVDNALLHLASFGGEPLASPFSQALIQATTPGDCNLDGTVNQRDYASVLANMGSTSAHWFLGDLNNDGIVSIDDLAEVTSHLSAGSAAAPFVAGSLSASMSTAVALVRESAGGVVAGRGTAVLKTRVVPADTVLAIPDAGGSGERVAASASMVRVAATLWPCAPDAARRNSGRLFDEGGRELLR